MPAGPAQSVVDHGTWMWRPAMWVKKASLSATLRVRPRGCYLSARPRALSDWSVRRGRALDRDELGISGSEMLLGARREPRRAPARPGAGQSVQGRELQR